MPQLAKTRKKKPTWGGVTLFFELPIPTETKGRFSYMGYHVDISHLPFLPRKGDSFEIEGLMRLAMLDPNIIFTEDYIIEITETVMDAFADGSYAIVSDVIFETNEEFESSVKINTASPRQVYLK